MQPTILYGSETWNAREREKKKLNVFEMRCLRSMIGVSRVDRIRNNVIRQITGVERDLARKSEDSVLRWYGHMERMGNERLAKKLWN